MAPATEVLAQVAVDGANYPTVKRRETKRKRRERHRAAAGEDEPPTAVEQPMAEQPESQPAAVAEVGDESGATVATLTGQALTGQAAPTSSHVEHVGQRGATCVRYSALADALDGGSGGARGDARRRNVKHDVT